MGMGVGMDMGIGMGMGMDMDMHMPKSMHMHVSMTLLDQVTASQLCVTLPTESLDALMGVTDGLLLAVLGEGARCVQELDLEEERDLAGEP